MTRDKPKKLDKYIVNVALIAVYFLISIFVFRKLIFSEGFIGFRDDWSLPVFRHQYISQVSKMLFSWSSDFLGSNPVRRLGYFVDMFFSFFSWSLGVDGYFFTGAVVVVTFCFSGYFTYLFLKDFLYNKTACFLGSLLYMFSPMFFNATVSGYFVFMISYALLPVFFRLFVKSLNSESKSLFHAVLAGLILRFIISQDNFVFIVFMLLSSFYIFERHGYQNAANTVDSYSYYALAAFLPGHLSC